MSGAQYFVRDLSQQEASQIQPWTKSQINDLVRSTATTLETNDGEAGNVILSMLQYAIIKPGLHTVATLLGEVPGRSGGTPFAPRTPAEWMQRLQ